MLLHRFTKSRAPEFPDGLSWLNSEPLTLKALRGRVVLVDFWTYSCVNCLRTQSHLNRWHELYHDKGLTIIGVHTPEFAFEKEKGNVRAAIESLGITYPVVQDNDYAVWNVWSNKYWPTKYLVDDHGKIIYSHAGEGSYEETERDIQQALGEIGVKDKPAIPPDTALGGSVCYRVTPELYLGYQRGRIANHHEHLPDVEEAFTDSAGEHEDDVPYLNGHFRVSAEYVEHARTTPSSTEYLRFTYSAFGVNMVMSTKEGTPSEIEIELDGQPLHADLAGADVHVDPAGRSTVVIDAPRMYQLVRSKSYHRGTLKVKIAGEGVRFHAVTFEGCG